jgi:hypothetical protein
LSHKHPASSCSGTVWTVRILAGTR